jgi:uncharacterized protein YdcH (DUF465 family)
MELNENTIQKSPSPETSQREPETIVEQLQREHNELKERLHELERHVSLTAEEQVERARLKKLKLATKDRIAALTAH